MVSPFPGMDPYLEAPDSWSTVHHYFIATLGEELGSALPPGFWVEIDRRTYIDETEGLRLVGKPDAGVFYVAEEKAPYGGAATVAPIEITVPEAYLTRVGYLKIKRADVYDVITVLEVLSPSNKLSGSGRMEYLVKRNEILASDTNLVEIDLLRAGKPLPREAPQDSKDYSVLVSSMNERPRALLYEWSISETPPIVQIPLRPEDPKVQVSIKKVLSTAYERGHFERWVDYSGDPPPPTLQAKIKEWVDATLRDHGLR